MKKAFTLFAFLLFAVSQIAVAQNQSGTSDGRQAIPIKKSLSKIKDSLMR